MTPQYSSDWTDDDLVTLYNICMETGTHISDVLSVGYSESGDRSTAHNPNGNASGILQFMPKILVGLGWLQGDAAFRQLTVRQQLPFVRRYLAQYTNKNLNSVSRLYLAVFLPAFLDRATDPDYVLVDKNKDAWNRMVFTANAGFDENHDLKITLSELGDAVKRNCRGPRYAELIARATGQSPQLEPVDSYDLGSIDGIQRAMVRLGYDPGTIDGIIGPHTYAAIRQFQGDHGLNQDGVFGPRTKATMSLALKALPSSPSSR